jgi:hypothetical protein
MISDGNQVESDCKNCSHPIASHKPKCEFKTNDNDDVCGCSNPQYNNAIISGKYIGWTEIHCTSCGVLFGFIDSTMEDIYDCITLCPNCIVKTYHIDSDLDRKS